MHHNFKCINNFIEHVDIVLQPMKVVWKFQFWIILHLKVIYTSNNNIDMRNGYTIQWICILLFIYFKCTSFTVILFSFCNPSVKLQSLRFVDYVHIWYFNISVAVRSLANRGPMYLLPFFNFLIKMFWFTSVWSSYVTRSKSIDIQGHLI